MITVPVNLDKRSYSIYIGSGILNCLGDLIKGLNFGKKALLVSNPAVYQRYGEIVEKSLAGGGVEVIAGEIGDGEEYKTLDVAAGLYDLAFSCGLDRRCPVIALGGGVVGDLAGFIAATYMRGVPFIQVPTTLLAQVDSSVGGKVAVNHPRGKNIIGAFYQPALVLADLETLKTLPAAEIKSGLAEIIKYGVISDGGFFAWLEENLGQLLGLRAAAMEHAVETSCRIKAEVVEADETEQGLRAVLNLGHTVGHAVEALTGYKVFSHGEAVGMGMAVAARMALRMGMLPEKEAGRIISLIERAGLPAALPADFTPDEILEVMRRDKKSLEGRLTMVLPAAVGQVRIIADVTGETVKKTLETSI
ncbi:3-dehydroquinate synthase [Pelotomaculum propionicicum]|uniref:3-dehydroquinate synthase n=1 Tax=Pelotomaculum propionicicum TaxID=258475 RepID=A0A4Y7RLH1_9FIRM|nr:3-dehydroquinate synthase [Pelotomaculum propionicicum]NLI11371.1 3-dehydroquinate synthase [Peptococcaceae bacterium]TEB09590.1 3-dehydroquinate synthase [Pelotomaculum propionicicum]